MLTCDGALYRGKVVAVIAEEIQPLRKRCFLPDLPPKYISSIVAMSLERNTSFRNAQKRIPKSSLSGIQWFQEIRGENKISELELYNRKTKQVSLISVDGVFIYVESFPITNLWNPEFNWTVRVSSLQTKYAHQYPRNLCRRRYPRNCPQTGRNCCK